MNTTQRSESMNAFFYGYVHAKTNLKESVDQFDNALRKKIENENVANFHSFSVTTLCISRSPIEKRFQELYTNSKFKEVQQEVTGMIDMNPKLHKSDGAVKTYLVKDEVHLEEFTKLMITLAVGSKEHTQDAKAKLYGMIDLYRANQEPLSMTQTGSNVGCTRGDATIVGGSGQVRSPNVVRGKGRSPSLRRASRMEKDMRKVKAKAKAKKAPEKGKRKKAVPENAAFDISGTQIQGTVIQSQESANLNKVLASENSNVSEDYDGDEQFGSKYGFVLRIVLLLVITWMTLFVISSAIMVVPISFGRALVPLLPITHGIKCNDLYAFIIGSYVIWTAVARAIYSTEHIRTKRAAVFPIIMKLLTALCVPYVLARGVFPMLGVPISSKFGKR
ncbi:hypothetical protein EZV62_011270 [Acer yangbiense]|uniref:RING-type E3 ubiquitin transferase n=1 Tax=Acer yangbiense TaxID=1000413 RepID=A0A5C7I719_9ROSI|nr:hypothetical protein EZV62_011270 [Acer yangbiense]